MNFIYLTQTENVDVGLNKGFLLPIILVLVPAIVSFIVAKLQYKYDINKVKLENEYQQKRDNTNFLTKIKIEEASKLINSMIFIRNNVQVYPLLLLKEKEKNQSEIELLDQFEIEIKNLIIYVNYFPDLKKEVLDYIKYINNTVAPIFISHSRGRKLEGSELEEIRFRTLALANGCSNIIEKISKEVEEQIQKLGN